MSESPAQEEYADNSEEFLLKLFNKPQSQKSKQLTKILQNNPSWPVLYHLSPQRETLLNWYPFSKNATLLEVGAGCGALTGLFLRRVKKVYASELTEARSNVIRKRYANKKNLEVISGNLLELNLKEPVDYLVVVGVLEYAGKFFINVSEDDFYTPFLMFLKHIKKYLKPKGKILLAIENKMGLKYMAGGREDHYGTLFTSLENYPNYNGIRTFSKSELTSLFKSAGFEGMDYYYPFPDYKLPIIVFSEHFLKNGLNLPKSYYAAIADQTHDRVFLYNEVIFAENLFKERVLDKFANSFLVEARI